MRGGILASQIKRKRHDIMGGRGIWIYVDGGLKNLIRISGPRQMHMYKKAFEMEWIVQGGKKTGRRR